ncbi:Dehydrogenase (flavoprotein) [Pseudarcicella hirudinis]|uniref:Dehydrogenase (Flavoprotein) n=1 Tax=Pseudarcicella hirudinis TaxID=1079859 RepID=A0A1I5RQE6_9BACT|nr:NAD(P)/FAD-dependent oxidoreductase [Pseudarcicella hirudinis]SFP60126.1 Dehydrogenase (flavoprotein) [Pseudarcicella hirudinis]
MAYICDTIIIGGGLAGLTSSILLAKAGKKVLLLEKKTYPFHKVCGEYISNETLPFLNSLGLDLSASGVAEIKRFQLSSPSGRTLETDLDLGGFGISRYKIDQELAEIAKQNGVTLLTGKTVEQVIFEESGKGNFIVKTTDFESYQARYVIGAYGKRAKLDVILNRDFLLRRSPYLAVKYHIKTDFPKDLIALHNFKDGYCGISAIEDNKYCLCYLTTRNNLKKSGTIPEMEQKILWKNPHLRRIFQESAFLYEKPEVINEISFAPKNTVQNHILMAGDTAGLITPLCGNGMAMAIHAGKILSELLIHHFENRNLLEKNYETIWHETFSRRLWIGRNVQQLFGNELLSELAISTLKTFRFGLKAIIKATHGEVF